MRGRQHKGRNIIGCMSHVIMSEPSDRENVSCEQKRTAMVKRITHDFVHGSVSSWEIKRGLSQLTEQIKSDV